MCPPAVPAAKTGQVNRSCTSMAVVPPDVIAHSSAPAPPSTGRPATSNGAASNKGARARCVNEAIVLLALLSYDHE